MKDITEAGATALREAVETIEKGSSVEVVIAVRARARRWLVPHVVVGSILAAVMLAITLWADTEFDLWTILALPIAAGLIGGLIVEEIPAFHRAWPQPELAREAARATFVERKVHATHRRTGLLVYIALRERHIELVGDVALDAAIPQATLDGWARAIEPAIPGGAEAIAKALVALAKDLASKLPRHEGDVNELPDEVVMLHPRGKRVA